ncbi:MAG: phosphopentomutase [Lachnospiraceae bacterium]|nr:phosphopentomutase [Lachnospiraceae bacterium]
MFKRAIWIILDSVGIGEMPDAEKFGDAGADTLGHVNDYRGKLNVPNLEKLGLFSIEGTAIYDGLITPIGAYGKAAELSNGKDTTTGHWEMVGIETKKAFPTYPDGFPEEVMKEFLEKTGLAGYLGNCVASGTTIINELGDRHVSTGYPIIYTSADSVFQIAAHEDVIPVPRLYEICEIAREMLRGEHEVARVIARPFIKEDGKYVRTSNRHDYSIKPTEENLLSYMNRAGYRVTGVGKIGDIFCGVGIGDSVHTKSNIDGMEKTLDFMDTQHDGLIFTNLVEFDSTWGHRRDVEGYASGLEAFDQELAKVLAKMKEDDLLIINADHGCDPTFKGTDHTREYIPVIMYHKKMNKAVDLGTLDTFADIGATLADNFGVKKLKIGKSLKNKLIP